MVVLFDLGRTAARRQKPAAGQEQVTTPAAHEANPDGGTVDAEGGYWSAECMLRLPARPRLLRVDLFILLAVLAHHSRLAALPADGSGRVVRWVDGRPSMVVQLPVPNATSCTFGGADLDTLYITTAARKDPNPSPSSGGLFAARPGVAGLPEPYYIP